MGIFYHIKPKKSITLNLFYVVFFIYSLSLTVEINNIHTFLLYLKRNLSISQLTKDVFLNIIMYYMKNKEQYYKQEQKASE